MSNSEEVFISYSQDSVDHIQQVLQLSNRLRSEGVDCVLDQYEKSPEEGWPRWMDKKIRDSKYVLMICTKSYYKRVMGEEEEGVGRGVRWEGNLIYQHFYNAGTLNNKFIPVVFDHKQRQTIPTPLQGATYYCPSSDEGFDELYAHLTDQDTVERPELGKRRPLSEKVVITNPAMYITSPIDLKLWDSAQWSATFFAHTPGRPPVLGLAYRNESAARKIFEGWHERYGNNDEYEELRISIIEGDIEGEKPGYSVHVGVDPETAIKRFKDAGYEFDGDLLLSISRINRMNPPADSNNLNMFKQLYRQYKTYYLVPGVVSEDGSLRKPILELGIFKSKVIFKKVEDIAEHDIDIAVLGTGDVDRGANKWVNKDTSR